jgi:hypothetical protein
MTPFSQCSEVTSFLKTCRVLQTIVFRYREIGGGLCTKHRKKVWFLYLTNIMTGTKRIFNILYTIYTPDISVAEHYG